MIFKSPFLTVFFYHQSFLLLQKSHPGWKRLSKRIQTTRVKRCGGDVWPMAVSENVEKKLPNSHLVGGLEYFFHFIYGMSSEKGFGPKYPPGSRRLGVFTFGAISWVGCYRASHGFYFLFWTFGWASIHCTSLGWLVCQYKFYLILDLLCGYWHCLFAVGIFSGFWSPSSTKNLGFLRVLCTDLGASPYKASAVCLTLGCCWPLQVCRTPEGLQQRGELPHIFHWLIFDFFAIQFWLWWHTGVSSRHLTGSDLLQVHCIVLRSWYWWMCSVLSFLAITIIAFTLISDYVNHCLGFGSLKVLYFSNFNHGYAHTKEGPTTWTSKGSTIVASSPERSSHPPCESIETIFSNTWSTPFSGSYVFGSDFCRNDLRSSRTMEMSTVQTSLLRATSTLRSMWTAMEDMCRSRFCSLHAVFQQSTSSLDAGTMGRRRLASRPMGAVSPTQTVTKAQVPSASAQTKSCQRQRKGKKLGRVAKLWTAIIACDAICGSTLAGIFECCPCSRVQCLPINSHWAIGNQGGQGARPTDEVIGCSIEASQRRTARRFTDSGEGSDCAIRAGRDEVVTFSCLAARQSKEGSLRGTNCPPADACCLAQLPRTICRAMDSLYGAVRRARKAIDGPPQAGPGQSPGCEGKPWGLQDCGRSHGQGRDGPDERWRGSRCQGHRGNRRPENSCKLQGLGLKSPDPPLSGRTGSRDRSRARSITQTPKDCSHRDASRSIRTQSAVFWRARVNTHAKCIAPGLPKPHAFGEFFKNCHPANAMTDQPTFLLIIAFLTQQWHGCIPSCMNPILSTHGQPFHKLFILHLKLVIWMLLVPILNPQVMVSALL